MFKKFKQSSKFLSLMLALVMVFGITGNVFAGFVPDDEALIINAISNSGEYTAQIEAVEVGGVTRYTGYIEFPEGSTQDLSKVKINADYDTSEYNLEIAGSPYVANKEIDFSKGYINFNLKNQDGTIFRNYQVNAGVNGMHVQLVVSFNVKNAEEWADKPEAKNHKDYNKVINALDGFSQAKFTSVRANVGQSAMKALEDAATQLNLELDGANKGYIREINKVGFTGLREFDINSKSGWMYKINGKMPNIGASQCIISNSNKTMEWGFTLNWGQDLGGAPW